MPEIGFGSLLLRSVMAAVIAYFLGSISFAYIVTKLKTGKDIRQIGSGSAGTTNTARAVGKPLAALVMVLDMLKGYVSASLGVWLAAETGGLVALVFVILGHTFPVWLGFHGGKGVACGAGAVWALSPVIFGVAALGFVVTVAATGYVSAGSICGCILVIISVLVLPEPISYRILYFVMAATVLILHRANIKRLLNGTESKTFHNKK